MNRLALNAVHYRSGAMDGLNRFTSEVARNLANLLPGTRVLTTAEDEFPAAVKTAPILARFGFSGNLSRLLWNQTGLRRRLGKLQADVFYSPVPEGMFRPVCPQIITVHDLLPVQYPDTYPRLKFYFRYALPRLLRCSDRIITISGYSKNELTRLYNVDPAKIRVVYPGYDPEFFFRRPASEVSALRKKYGIQGNYLLCVGESRPYKNFEAAIRAMKDVNDPHLKLVVVGDTNRLNTQILDLPKKMELENRVKFTGFVPDADLAALYSGAMAFIFPSLYEGFGLPPLEAMACGAPVIATDRAAVPEVCEEAALYFNPESRSELAERINQMISSEELRKNFRAKGLKQAGKFSWAETARKISEVLQPYLNRNVQSSENEFRKKGTSGRELK